MSYYLICPEGYPLVNGRARTAHYDDLETALWNADSMQRRGFPVQLIFGTPVDPILQSKLRSKWKKRVFENHDRST